MENEYSESFPKEKNDFRPALNLFVQKKNRRIEEVRSRKNISEGFEVEKALISSTARIRRRDNQSP